MIAALLFAVVIHEFAHGWVANKRGDSTARLAGRLTLNPLKHIDIVGTFIVPLVLRLLGLMPIGWAKPVPVNFANLRDPKRDMILVAIAGPAINIIAAVAVSLLLRWEFLVALVFQSQVSSVSFLFLIYFIYINLLLAVFNLMPIPPLDGSRIMLGLLPNPLARIYGQLEPFGLIILVVLLNLGFLNFIDKIISFLFIGLNLPMSPYSN